jgi:hypothetical protein
MIVDMYLGKIFATPNREIKIVGGPIPKSIKAGINPSNP